MGKKWIEKYYNKDFNQQITMDFLNDQICTLFSKVFTLVNFYCIDIFFPLTCISKSCLDEQPFLWTLLVD
jgi:hypothetical protein